MVVRNLGVAAAALAAALPTIPRGLTSLDLVTIAGAVLTLGALYAAQDALQRNRHTVAGSLQ